MPVVVGINSRESGQPVALTSGTLVTSQSGLNVVIQSGAFITNDSGVRVVIQSGAPVSLQSGLPVNIGSGIGVVAASGLFVITDSGQRVVIQSGAPVSLQSGLPVNIGSGVGVLIQSGISVNVGSGIGVVAASGLFIINDSGVRVVIQSGATVSLQSGVFVNVGLVSGIILGSGIAYQMSGANVIATVTVGSGLGVTVATSGQGFPVVGGQYITVDPVIASGQNWPLRVSADGDLRVYIDVKDASGINVVISGQPVYVSGTVAILSGSYVNIGSGIGIIQASGAYIINDSGVRVVIQSGAPVSLQSGLPVNIGSGIGVLIQSGINVNIGSGIGIIQASGAYIINDSGVRVVIQSGAPVSLQSGTFVNVGLVSGVILGSGLAYQISGANVIATVSVGLGLYTVGGGINRAINSGGQTVLASGVIAVPSLDVNGNLVVMTSGQTANMLSGQALYVQISGYKVAIDSGIAYQMSGANVIATVSVGSGLGVIATTSGQGFPLIGGQFRPVDISLASGATAVFSAANDGDLRVKAVNQSGQTLSVNASGQITSWSGQYIIATTSGQAFPAIGGINRAITSGGQTVLASGVIAIPSLDVNGNLVVMTSGQTANMLSGQALYVQQSGVNATQSGRYILALPLGAGAVVASTFIVNTSAVQLPNTSGREHILQIMDSGVYWIGGVNTTNSGIGFMWQGIPGTDHRSQLTLKIANLNLLYMKSQITSGKITILSMN